MRTSIRTAAVAFLGLVLLLASLPAAANDTLRLDRIQRRISQHSSSLPKWKTQSASSQSKKSASRTSSQALSSIQQIDHNASSNVQTIYNGMTTVLAYMHDTDTLTIGSYIGTRKATRLDEISNQYAQYVRSMSAIVLDAQGGTLQDYEQHDMQTIAVTAKTLSDEFDGYVKEFKDIVNLMHGIKP